MGSMVQIFPQHVTTVHVLFPATGKRAPMHQQDFMPFKPSLEVDNQTLSEKAYAFILPFWVQKAQLNKKILIVLLHPQREYWDFTDNILPLIINQQ